MNGKDRSKQQKKFFGKNIQELWYTPAGRWCKQLKFGRLTAVNDRKCISLNEVNIK